MDHTQGIFFIDVSFIIFMFVLAYLSKRLGEALKIPPYYKMLYISAIMIIGALIIDVLSEILTIPSVDKISLFIRFTAGFIACAIVLRYWVWVFSEFFKH